MISENGDRDVLAEVEARNLAEETADTMNDAQLAQRLDLLAHRLRDFDRYHRDALLREAARRLRSGRRVEGAEAPRAHL